MTLPLSFLIIQRFALPKKKEWSFSRRSAWPTAPSKVFSRSGAHCRLAAHEDNHHCDRQRSRGSDNLSEGARQLIQRAAILGAYIEDHEARWLAGEKIALEDYLASVKTQKRVLCALGLERRSWR